MEYIHGASGVLCARLQKEERLHKSRISMWGIDSLLGGWGLGSYSKQSTYLTMSPPPAPLSGRSQLAA